MSVAAVEIREQSYGESKPCKQPQCKLLCAFADSTISKYTVEIEADIGNYKTMK